MFIFIVSTFLVANNLQSSQPIKTDVGSSDHPVHRVRIKYTIYI